MRNDPRALLKRAALLVVAFFLLMGFCGKVIADELLKEQAVCYFKEALEAQRSGDIDYAISLYLKAIYTNPNYVKAYNNLGTAYAQKEDMGKAEEAYNQAIEIDPHYSTALKNLAIIYAQRGDYDKSFDYWKRASGLDIYSPFIIDDEE